MEVHKTWASPILERRYLAALCLEESNLEKWSKKELRAFSEKVTLGEFLRGFGWDYGEEKAAELEVRFVVE